MKRIKITSGVYGHSPEGPGSVSPISAGGTVLVSEAEAARLVALRVAEYAEGSDFIAPGIAGDGPNSECKENGEQPLIDDDGRVTSIPEYNADTPQAELKELFEDCGLSFKVGMSKAQMVAALDVYFADDEDGEVPPALGTEDPVT